jgi:precorrin-6Y C5,15-methyltransferase (decarboxylating) CbiT subunit
MTNLQARGVVADDWFERSDGIPMTKGPLRALALSILMPLGGARVLEIGSGSGAMTVELARSVGDGGSVASVELLPEASKLAAKNIGRAGLGRRVELTTGSAPEAIPDGEFDAVFVGGHGREMEAVIGACWSRLAAGGRLLLTAITPRTTVRALAHLAAIGADVGFWRAHTSVGRAVGEDWLLLGNNPIDLIWGDK